MNAWSWTFMGLFVLAAAAAIYFKMCEKKLAAENAELKKKNDELMKKANKATIGTPIETPKTVPTFSKEALPQN